MAGSNALTLAAYFQKTREKEVLIAVSTRSGHQIPERLIIPILCPQTPK